MMVVRKRLLFIIVGLLLAIVATSCSSTQASQPTSTSNNAPIRRFNAPGNLLISDQFNNRVVELAPNGHIVWTFGSGNPTLCNPGLGTIIGLNDAERLSGGLTLTVLLAACGGGGGSTANTDPATTPTTIANTPPANTSSVTPTPTPRQAPVPGSTVVVLITIGSNGSFSFSPASLTITVGAAVIWKNMSSVPHTITSDDGQTFDSGNIPPGGSYQFKFTTPGSFPYHCNIHPYMRATINL
jgi:plastocyanin